MILAIDQGSSKTQALVGDTQGNILGTGLAEGACHFHVGMDAAMAAVKTAADRALKASGIHEGEIGLVSAGMSGANWPDEFKMLTEGLQMLFCQAEIHVYNDSIPALFAGTQASDAIILCAGTAFNCAVLKNDEVVWIYNNYTEMMDEGGKSLGTRAMQKVFRSDNCLGPETSMKHRAMDFFGYDKEMDMLLDFSRNCLSKPIKDFAKIVDEEAIKGDQVALETQYEFSCSLSRYAVGAMKRFNLLNKPIDIVLSGGIFKARSPVMIDAIRTEIHRASPLARIVEARYEPVVGAFELALSSGEKQMWLPRVQKTATEFSLERF